MWRTIVLGLVCCMPLVVLAQGKELIENGGLEGPYTGGVPKGWHKNCYGINESIFSEETEDVHGGKSALKVECTSFEGGAIQFLSRLRLKKGKNYRCSFWLRAEGGVDLVYVLLRQCPAPYRKHVGKKLEPTTQWQRYDFEGICLSDEENAGFFVNFRPADKGTIWLDDVSVIELDPSAVVESEMPPAHNIVPNGSFEICPWRDWRVVGADGALDDSSAAAGAKSLRIGLAGGSCQVRSRLLKFATGRKEFTLSAYVKGQALTGDVSIELMPGIVISGQGPRLCLDVQPTREWRQYRSSGVFEPSMNGYYYLRVTVPGAENATVWIDGISLQLGVSEQTYSAASPVEYALSTDKVANIFRKGEPIEITCEGHNDSNEPRERNLICRAIDFWGNEAAVVPVAVSMLEKATLATALKFPIEQTGVYRAELTRQGQEDVLAALCFSILLPVNPTPGEQSNVGGHFTLNDFHMQVASLTGIKWTRIHDASSITHWKTAEPEKGKFQWFDDEVAVVKKHGVGILGEFLRVPEWASSAPKDIPDREKRLFPPRDMAEYMNYVKTVVNHYKDRIHHWEIWNEPYGSGFFRGTAEQYAQLAQATVRAAREADPSCKLLAPCTCGHVPEWTKNVLVAGGLNGVDIFSYHGYGMFKFPRYEYMKEYARYGRKSALPIWNTETGATSESFYANLEDEFVDAYTRHISPMPYDRVAALTVRYYVLALAGGAERFFLYWTVHEPGLLPRLSAMTFFEYDGSLRPYGVAYAIAASVLDGAAHHERVPLSPMVEALIFTGHERTIAVLFGSNIARNDALPVSVSAENVRVLDVMGNEVAVERTEGQTLILLGRMPLYLIADSGPKELATALRSAKLGTP